MTTGASRDRLGARLVLITIASTLLPVMVTMDATIVNVAQRTFVDQFHSTQAVVAWTVTGYSLGLAAVIPVTGWAAGKVGTKVLVLVSVAVFSWASLLCAQAPNIAALVAFRALQGLGGGTLMPLQLLILARAAGPQRLARVLTLSMVPILMAPICGPILGGWLIDSFGWRWVFLVNVPIGLITMVFAGFVLPEDVSMSRKSFDFIGALLLSPGVLLLLYGVSLLPERRAFTDARVLLPASVGFLLIAAFIVHALHRPDRALIDLRLLGVRDVAVANGIRFLFALSFVGCCLLFPAYLQQVLSKTPAESALLLIPQTLAAAAVTPLVGRWVDRRGPRAAVLVGTGLCVLGLGVFVSQVSRHHPDLSLILAGLALFGAGSGCMMTPVSWSAVHRLKPAEVANGATLFNVNHNLAASVGAASMSVIVGSGFNRDAGTAYISGHANDAYVGAFVVAMVLFAVIAAPACALPNHSLRTKPGASPPTMRVPDREMRRLPV